MSNLLSLASRKKTHSPKMSKQYFNSLTRSIVVLGLIATSNPLGLSPVLAAPTAPNVTISNQATGTFTDGDDPDALPESIVSNVVTVTVAEVAGITITADNTPTPYPNSLVNFDFEIKNIGNDPTKFFLPTAPANVAGGTAGTLQIVAYVDANGVKTTLTNSINITAADNTGAIGDGTFEGKTTDGSIPVGAAIIVRVPVTVTAAANASVSVTLGNTAGSPNASNTPYIANTNDVYTVDNADTVAGEAAGVPINGDGPTGDGDITKHRQEASETKTVIVQNPPLKISGTVFEDVNYGGGAGRDLVSSGGVVRPNVRVEIYDANGFPIGQMLTDTNGQYAFDASNVAGGLTLGNQYQIRVVNSFVTSSRPGGCASAAGINLPPASCLQVPVQTFRTSGDTDSNNIADADQNRVGGEVPAKKDALANNGSQTLGALNSVTGQAVESLTTVVMGSVPFTGVDFGFNFDTIVNTNDAGQGSLRQFITNSNTLTNAGLAQVGQTVGKEVSIFMISDGSARPGIRAGIPSGLTSGVAIIIPSSNLPAITDANTILDGRTQTTNVGNTNSGTLGTGGTVGVGSLPLSTIPRPEVAVSFQNFPINSGGLSVQAANVALIGMSLYGTDASSAQIPEPAALVKLLLPTASDRTTLTQLAIGAKADGSDYMASRTQVGIYANRGSFDLTNSYLAFNGQAIEIHPQSGNSSNNNLIENNEFTNNGTINNKSAWDHIGINIDQPSTSSTGNIIRGNYIHDSRIGTLWNTQDAAIELIGPDARATIENNTIERTATAGISLYTGTHDNLISQNIIRSTRSITQGGGVATGSGIVLKAAGGQIPLRNRITQNSTYGNDGLSIDFSILGGNLGDGVTPNDGLTNPNQPNNGMDYPIITSSSISGSTLTIKGYVGTPTNSSTFAGATLEFFVGAADTNDRGKVFISDPSTVSKLHAEGQTYLGTCTADPNGKFDCSIVVPTGTDPRNITATATDAAGNTSEFSASNIDPRLLLVKRITAINGSTNTTNGDNLANYLQDDANPYDDNTIETTLAPSPNFPAADTTFWPNTTAKTSSTFLIGGMNGGNIKPKDVIEYTIYFLSNGDSTATNVLFCDRVPANVTFVPTAFDSALFSKAPGGVADSRGILTQLNGSEASYTNVADGDAARYFPAGSDPKLVYPKVNCGGTNDNGAVVVDLGSLPNATAVGTPGSYGFVRFQGRVK
jgi:trimeric autotransporter adhesin